MSPPRHVAVDLGDRSYDVVLDEHGFEGLGPRLDATLGASPRVVVVTDDNVGQHWAVPLRQSLGDRRVDVISLPPGEAHKTVATWSGLVSDLLALEVDRATPVIALGGGVVGDMAGFAAACTLRGLPFVQVPTSLLAMVDASVGGKTAVNHPRGKNLLGAFHQPALVWVALPTLGTLPAEERTAGLGEVIKTALIGDLELLAGLETGSVSDLQVVEACVRTKARVVAADEREQGQRALLNAGHTVGHALETAAGHGRVLHGHAVAMGLVAEARFAVRRGVCEQPDLPDRIARLARRLSVPVDPPPVDAERFRQALRHDKKATRDTVKVPLPVRAGLYKLVALPWDALEAGWN